MRRSAAATTAREEEDEEMSPADDPYSDSAGEDEEEEGEGGEEQEVEEKEEEVKEEDEEEDEEEVEEEEEEEEDEDVKEEDEVVEEVEEDEDEDEDEMEEVDEEGDEEGVEEGEEEELDGNIGEEVEEEEDEEEEEEQVHEEVEAEKEREGRGSDLSDSSASMDEDAKVELQINPEVNGHVAADIGSSVPLIRHSSELVADDDRDMKPEVSIKHMVSSEKNGLPESFTEIDDTEVFVGKGTAIDDKNESCEDRIDCQFQYLDARDPCGAEIAKSLHVNVEEVIEQTMTEKGSGNGEPDVNIRTKKEMLHLPRQADLQVTDKKLTESSSCYPHQRPRSPSADAILENQNKRPASVCDFYARGWCIKGKSCRFLHHKDGVDVTSQRTVEDPVGQSTKELQDEKGLSHDVKKSPTLQESLSSPDAESSLSKSQLSLQRALVRAYGGESHGINQLYDEHMSPSVQREKLHLGLTSENDSGQAATIDSDVYLSKYEKHTSMKSREESFGGKIPGSGHRFDSPLSEIQKAFIVQEEYNQSYGINASRSPFTENSLNPQFRYPLSGSSVGSSMYQSSKNPFISNKGMADLAVLKQESQFSHHESSTPYRYISSNSSYTNSLLPAHNPPSIYASTHGSPLSTEHLHTHKSFNIDGGYYGSRSGSLPRSSSPYFSRPELENSPLHNTTENPSLSRRSKAEFQVNSWEPSVPFRPSFSRAPSSISSPGSQYDPLLDSIEPPSAFNGTFQGSQITNFQSMSSQHTITDSALSGNQSSEYNTQRHLNLFPQSGIGGYSSAVSAFISCTGDGENVSSMSKERTLSPDRGVDIADIHEVDLNNYLSQADKGRHNKESKASKIFRSALVEFVKELVKPAWREGHLSKDAHKMIVKKAVEKVLSALQSHQFPSTTESINQYLSSSRPKLVKLVEGYVDKYSKS